MSYPKLSMPVRAVGSSGYDMLNAALQDKAEDLQLLKIESSGHFLLEEQPDVISGTISIFFQ
jgi:pimeloyl-ACP methyl ester carboxylesterase